MNQPAQNIKFTKTFRTEVLLFNEATSGGTTTFGRYYFDDIRELNGKQIVGFSVDLGYNAVTRPATITNDDFTQYTQGANYSIATEFDLPALFLNLYNDQKELILDNFPALLATGFNAKNATIFFGPPLGQRYIFPLDCKLDIRSSYIFGNATLIPDNVVVSVNFYYN
jgi:hypothetical protein